MYNPEVSNRYIYPPIYLFKEYLTELLVRGALHNPRACHSQRFLEGKVLGEQRTVSAFKELSVQWKKGKVVREIQYRVESHKTEQLAWVDLEGGHLPSLRGSKAAAWRRLHLRTL